MFDEKKNDAIAKRAKAIFSAGGLDRAIEQGSIDASLEVTLSEALVLGLLKQGVRKYFAIFGHGSTDLGEVLRIYQENGVTQTFNCRNEVEMAHAATALRWQYGETSAVVTSIGPGALQALSGSLASASNGVGVYHIYGDETTWGEGYNMQQIPKRVQGAFGQITALMGQSYVLHTPNALREGLRRGSSCVYHPVKPGPFYFLLPLNTQPEIACINLKTLPSIPHVPSIASTDLALYAEAIEKISHAKRIAIKAGGGTRGFDKEVKASAEKIGAAVVLSPGSTGVLPDNHPQNMHVGGSKGSISGNYAMENADLLISIGSRSVCQSDCSGIGYPNVEAVININGDLDDLLHYAGTIGLAGDIGVVISRLIDQLDRSNEPELMSSATWLEDCLTKKSEWIALKNDRCSSKPIMDVVWARQVLTQPCAISTVAKFAKSKGATKFFDAGDVQANGFQIVEDDSSGQTYTESGASYMGFAISALLASAVADKPSYSIAFTGDGSFMMNPQVLIDGVEHGARGMIVLFDNRRMAAISGLQEAQYQAEFSTNDKVEVDYVKLASAVGGVNAIFGGYDVASLQSALVAAYDYDGLSFVHVPVYYGRDPLGGMGAYGSWNVGNWVKDVQNQYLNTKI